MTSESELDGRPGDVAAIESLLESLERCVASADATVLEHLLAVDVLAVFSGGGASVRGIKAVMETWRRHMALWGDVKIRRRDTVVRIHGDVAWSHFLWDGEGTSNGQPYRLEGERWTAVLVWEAGAWRIVQTHTSMPYSDWESHRV
jgi:ketosteroid isomerase-like protein